MKAFNALRSAIFLTGFGISCALFSLAGQLLRPLPLAQRAAFLLLWNRLMLRWVQVACGVRWQLHGDIPGGPYVALSKHQSEWETICLQAILFPVSVVLKAELLSIPFFGWSLALMEPVPINRGNPKDAIRNMLRHGRQRLERGLSVLIFPEGTRTPRGKRGRYARGGAALAIEAGVPVLPIAHNAGSHWPADSWIKIPGTIHVVIGAPVDPAGHNSRDVTTRIEAWIESTVAAIERGEFDTDERST